MNAWDKPHAELRKLIGKHRVFYSVGADMNDIAIEGKAVLVAPFDEFWADEGEDYRSEVVENPTWLDLAVLADEAINTTGDYHHHFFEGIRPWGVPADDSIPEYYFVMGS